MLFSKGSWAGVADGTITVAFRRWRRPTVKPGGTLQSPGGLLAIDEVARIELADITDADLAAAGVADVAELVRLLRPEGDLYRVRFHRIGGDARIALRQDADLDAAAVAAIRAALGRAPWALPILRLIAASPGTVSTDLAPTLGMERLPFKQRVRRLKALGLTESLRIGYQLSPRGTAFLAAADGDERASGGRRGPDRPRPGGGRSDLR